jgi:hypothetical protein
MKLKSQQGGIYMSKDEKLFSMLTKLVELDRKIKVMNLMENGLSKDEERFAELVDEFNEIDVELSNFVKKNPSYKRNPLYQLVMSVTN